MFASPPKADIAAVVKNMHRLRALRLSQASKASASIPRAKAKVCSQLTTLDQILRSASGG
jgi:hypothetical protein